MLKLDPKKIEIARARAGINITNLAKAYGVSRARMNVILNSIRVTPECVGRLARALHVDVTDLIEE